MSLHSQTKILTKQSGFGQHFKSLSLSSSIRVTTTEIELESESETDIPDSRYKDHISERITTCPAIVHTPVVAVIGVGYVGTHLVEAFSRVYDHVIGFDVSEERLATLQKARPDLKHVVWSHDPNTLSRATHILVAVPTLVKPSGDIDTSNVTAALQTLNKFAQRGSTIVVESSVAVGMTRTLLKGLIKTRGIKAGMSPERVDPGRKLPLYTSIPKLISGLDDLAPGSLSSIQDLYAPVFSNVIPVSSPEVAEMTKLYENCQRLMCIAFANEMADACRSLSLDPFEVTRAAASKPFGYLPITPSLGVGGYCVPVNGKYLFSSTPASSFPLLRHAMETTAARPLDIGDRLMERLYDLDSQRACPRLKDRRARILVVGVGFKRGQSVLAHSPGLALLEHLVATSDAEIQFADPLVQQSQIPHVVKFDHEKRWHKLGLAWFDVVVLAVRQEGLLWKVLDDLPGTLVERWCD